MESLEIATHFRPRELQIVFGGADPEISPRVVPECCNPRLARVAILMGLALQIVIDRDVRDAALVETVQDLSREHEHLALRNGDRGKRNLQVAIRIYFRFRLQFAPSPRP